MSWQVFLSYSRQQYYMAELLVLHLQKRGITVWFDMQQIEPGEQWKSEIQDGLENAEAVLLLLSKESLASPYVADEWRYALEHGRPVIVALVEYLRLPPELQNQPCIDCRGNLHEAVDTIHHAILHPDAPCQPVSSAPRHPDVIKSVLRAFRANQIAEIGFVVLMLILWMLLFESASVLNYFIRALMPMLPLLIPGFNPDPVLVERGVQAIGLVIISMKLLAALSPQPYRKPILEHDLDFIMKGPQQYRSMGSGAFYLWCILAISQLFREVNIFTSKDRQLLPISLVLVLLGAMIIIGVLKARASRHMPKMPHVDLLRWAPKGQAPEGWRTKLYASLLPDLSGVVAIDQPETFRLGIVASSQDKRLIRKIRPIIRYMNGTIVSGAEPADVYLLIMSHTTSRRSIAALLEMEDPKILVVIASQFFLPDELKRLSDFQYIDYSSLDRDKLFYALQLTNPKIANYRSHLQQHLFPIDVNAILPSRLMEAFAGSMRASALITVISPLAALLLGTVSTPHLLVFASLIPTGWIFWWGYRAARAGKRRLPRSVYIALTLWWLVAVTLMLVNTPAAITLGTLSVSPDSEVWGMILFLYLGIVLRNLWLWLRHPNGLGDADALGVKPIGRDDRLTAGLLVLFSLMSLFVIVISLII